MRDFIAFTLARSHRLELPILTSPGTALLPGATVRQMVCDAETQAAVVGALHARFQLPVVLSAMDLSAEAEAFGSEVQLSDNEVPTVVGRRVTSREDAERLAVPAVGAGRTGVALETVRRLRGLPGQPFVFGGMIGPFSLAARLCGVSEALGLTVEDPGWVHVVTDKATAFLLAQAHAFRAAGADGVVMAEPTAGLLSPRALAEFSSAYVQRIVTAVDAPGFTVVLHNCAAKLVHLPAVLAAGTRVVHFGAPMDLPGALGQAPATTVVAGNLDPSRVFVQGTPETVAIATRELLAATDGRRNFVISSGCDLPPPTPLANLEAFFAAARNGRR
ncbi:MAG: uroporphyrinogen decarboxylase family protein [Verrucomicrobia bacterium]|nr:uroporphyrinogen decarboxylase family protein [Verrucomicrobiota bacterium]